MDDRNHIAFDIGNVLYHVDMKSFYKFIVDRGITDTIERAEEFVAGIQYPQDLGLYNIRQGFYRFNPYLSKETLADLHDVWIDVAKPAEPMIALIEELIGEGYSIALLSNIGKDHAALIRQKCKIFEKCHQHFSCEVGARKPTKLYYQSFIQESHWTHLPRFFDDREENIQGAKGFLEGTRFDLDDYNNDEEAAAAMRAHVTRYIL